MTQHKVWCFFCLIFNGFKSETKTRFYANRFFFLMRHDARRLYTAHNDRGHFNPQSEVSVCFVYAVSPPPQDVEEN